MDRALKFEKFDKRIISVSDDYLFSSSAWMFVTDITLLFMFVLIYSLRDLIFHLEIP